LGLSAACGLTGQSDPTARRTKMRKILEYRRNRTRFEAIFLAGLCKGGMPEE
jgi:hypothetical protein